MTAISLIPLLLIVALFVVVPTLVVLWLAFDAIKRKNWSGLAVLAFTASALVLGGSLAVWSTAQRIVSDFGGVPELEFLPTQAAVATPTPPQPPTARVVSDEELAAVASAQPKIELDSKIVIDDKAENAKSDRPDWIDVHLGDNQKLIVAGPYAYAQACQIETDQELQKWLAEKFTGGEVTSETMKAVSSLALKNYKKEQHQEVRETSVGEFYILYTLAEVSPKSATEIAEFAKSMAMQAAKTARMKGAQFVTFTGAGVLSLVALAHVVLKSGGRKAKNGAP